MNLGELLRASAERGGDRIALVTASSGRKITFGEFDAEADRVAAALTAAGVRKGDRVAIGMHNIPEFPFAYFGALRAGAVVVPLNVMLTAAEVRKVLQDSGARAAFTAPPFASVLADAVDSTDVERVFSTDEWDSLAGADAAGFDGIEVGEEDLAVLAYTSGTTGEPKGAMLTHGNLLANLRQQMAIPEAHVKEDDVLLLALPFFHIFGLNVILGLLTLNGARGLLVERFEPVSSLEAIEEHGVTVLFGAPTMYSAWVNTPGADQYDLSKVRLAVSGAAPLPESVLQAFRSVFGVTIYEGYGLTETAPTLWSNRMSEEPRPGSVGKPLPDVEFRLIDENGNDVETGDPGEILVRGPNVFQGYWDRPAETESAFFHGWFRTGDIGVLDADGFLYLVDRKRDLIIVSGFNVFPSEVEAALLHNPKIDEAAVVGVPHPYTGEAVKAFVVLTDGASATEAEIIDDVQRRLARFKCPSAIEIVDSLPHLLTGKVLRRALRT